MYVRLYYMESSRKSLYLFEVQLDKDELEALVQLNPEILKKLLFRCARIFQKQLSNREAIAIFLNNYRLVMELHSAIIASCLSVDLCLHFALLYSQFLLLQGREVEAKSILKQTQEYVEIEGVDPMLVSLCLNNLSYLYSRQGKNYKSLAVALRAVGIIQEHLEQLREQKKREQLIEDVIVFVNVLMVTQRVLTNILRTSSKTFFKSLFKIVNRLGHSFSLKYLGSESLFTKKFYLPEDSVLLPVYQEEETEEKEEVFNQFELRIARELEHIYSALKELNLEPEVYYIKQHSVINSRNEQKNSSIHIETPTLEQEFSVCYTESFQISDWQAEVSFFREAQDLMVASPSYEFLGHIQFKLEHGRSLVFQKITEEQLIKIVNCLNIYDVMPFEFQLKKMAPSDFFRKILVRFVSVSSQGELRIQPRATPVIDPFQMRFCNQSTFIFVNHLYFRKFRVAICPLDSSETIYLDIDFKCKKVYGLFKLTELLVPGISQLYRDYHTAEQIDSDDIRFGNFKKIEMINSQVFKTKIVNIIHQFEVFITEEDTEIFTQGLTSTTSDDNYKYYQFVMEKSERGQFFQFRYRSNANYIEIYTKNTFKTYTPLGLAEARGNTVISPQQFFKDFGISLRIARKWLPSFYGVMAQKYILKVFEERIDEMDEDRYQENSISELPLICKFFKRKFILFEEYMLPLTIELITLNTEKPVGVKVSIYEPIKGINSGLFIYVNADYWERPAEKENEGADLDSQQFRRDNLCHNFKKGYFLTRWLSEEGFEKIFSKMTIVNRSIEIRGHSGKFIRLQEFF